MLRVLVSVQLEEETVGRDLEIPAALPALKLAGLLGQALTKTANDSPLPAEFTIFATPPGRILHPDESLADAGVWNGATLVVSYFLPAYFMSAGGISYPCVNRNMQIGRLPTNHQDASFVKDLIHLENEPEGKTVSRHHATVIYSKRQWRLTHAAQLSNQTLLNGQRLQDGVESVLHHLDRIQFGGVQLQFFIGAEWGKS